MSLSSCSTIVACWVSRSFSCAAMASRRVRASRARGSLSWPRAALACSANLSPWALQLLGLDLDALARGGDVGDGALDLGEVLELLLVREVERLAGVLAPC